MSDKASNQNAPEAQGFNLKGKAPNAPRRAPDSFMGKSGQPDNQSTSRGKGRS